MFCGKLCELKPDPRNPTRWKKVVRCATANYEDNEGGFKKTILDICDKRNDVQAEEVRRRVEGAVTDLHAADAIYHQKCGAEFLASRSI